MVLFRAVADDQLRCEMLVMGFDWRRELERLERVLSIVSLQKTPVCAH